MHHPGMQALHVNARQIEGFEVDLELTCAFLEKSLVATVLEVPITGTIVPADITDVTEGSLPAVSEKVGAAWISCTAWSN